MVLGLVAASVGTWTLVLGGDVMLNGVPASRDPFAGVAAVLSKADVAYANLEIPLTTAATRTTAKSAAAIRARDQFVLKADPTHLRHIRAAGFDLLSLGNNHAMDFGAKGLEQTRSLLRSASIAHTGAGHDAADAARVAVVRTRNGLRVGMVSYLAFRTTGGLAACTPARRDRPGVAALDLGGSLDAAGRARIAALVADARRSCDFLIVALHWGLEKQQVPTPYQLALGRAFAEAGADVVAGAHPHVWQGMENYRGKPIYYSLGNLVSPRPGVTGLARLTYGGTRLQKTEFLPAQIAGGRVRLEGGHGSLLADLSRKVPALVLAR